MSKNIKFIYALLIITIICGGFSFYFLKQFNGIQVQEKQELLLTSKNKVVKSWDFLKTDGSKLILKDGNSIDTKLFEMNFLKTLKDNNGNLYFVVSGKESGYVANISIYIFNSKNTQKSFSEIPNYSYPGKVYNWESNELISEHRLFVGDCIDFCLLWVQKDLMIESNEFKNSIYTVNIINGEIKGRIINSQEKEYNKYLQNIEKYEEILGKDFTSEP